MNVSQNDVIPIYSTNTEPNLYLQNRDRGTTETYNNVSLTLACSDNSSEAILPDGCINLLLNGFVPWLHPDNVVRFQDEVAFDRFKATILIPLLFLVSMPTNSLNMVIFFRQGLKERVHMCLFVLAFIDLAFIFFGFSMYGERVYFQFVPSEHRFGPAFQYILNHNVHGVYGLTWVAAFLTTVIACDRCFCVVSPFKARDFVSTKKMAVFIAVCNLLILTGYFFIAARWRTVCIFNPATKTTSPELFPSEFYIRNRFALDLLDGIVYGIFLPSLFLSLVTTSTMVMAFCLRRQMVWRWRTSTALSTKEVAVTRMLIGTSTLYVICTLPLFLFRVLILAIPEMSLTGHYYNLFTVLVSMTECFSYLNSSLNFFVYFTMSTKFRETFWSLVAGRRQTSEMPAASADGVT